VITALASIFREERPVRILALARIAFGCLLLGHVLRLARELRDLGYFGDRFFIPMIPQAWVPTHEGYTFLLGLIGVLALCAVLGMRAREALLVCAGSGLYLLACDRLQYHNNRYALLLLGFLLAFAPCDRAFSLRPSGEPVERAPVWAQRLMQMQVSLIYLSSCGSKLLDPDWFGGQVMWLRAAKSLEIIERSGFELPGPIAAAFGSKLVLNVVSKLAIGTELFIAIGAWWPRTRALALYVGVLFHLGIEIGANVELFSYTMWASYLTFVRPELRERTLLIAQDSAGARWLGALLRRLDWLSRFSLRTVPRGEISGARLCAIDRDGTRYVGAAAFALLARALPLLFPLWLPALLFARAQGATAARPAAAA